jgi:peptidoglycan/LPS O-acetylase OafA/YrhL
MSASNEALPHQRLKYRPDIDGLRAVAVLSVLAFHMGTLKTPGGFVGVDVFFVISGYLISFIVFSEVAESRFSIISFYERRIRRIFPALFGVLTAFTVFALVYLLPNELMSFGQSLLAATTSVSNFYFWLHSGYFDSPTSNPLLHTWSLGVEEQFYIVFPLFLVMVRKLFPNRLRTAVVVLFFISLAASAWIVRFDAQTAFYMLYTRAWELLMGTGLSLGMFPRLRHAVMRNLASLAGIALIAYAVMFYSKDTVFPGLSALAPVLGSALIIGAGESGSSLVGAVLSWRPVVFVGLISYSLYLWHWPVIVVQHLGVFGPMQHGTVAISSLILGFLSWRFVERPFRSGALRLGGRRLFIAAGAVMLVFITASLVLVLSGGVHGRFTPHAEEIASYLGRTDVEHQLTRYPDCFLEPASRFEDYKPDVCLHRDPAKKVSYLLVGDSHSAVLWSALAHALPDANVLQASGAPCKPFIHPIGSDACKKLVNYLYQEYLPAHPIQGLFLELRWREPDISGITETVAWARSRNLPVVVFGNVAEYDEALPRLLAYSLAWNKPQLVGAHRVAYSGPLDAKLQKLAADTWHVPYVSLYQSICDKGDCRVYADDAQQIPLFVDDDHFSREGALAIMHTVMQRGGLDDLPK